jgi:hypothetical protein
MYDPHILGKACLDYTRDYDVDATVVPPMVMHGPALEVLGYHLYKWPGRGIREEQGYQFVEKDYMKAEDYDHFIADPTDYWFRVWCLNPALTNPWPNTPPGPRWNAMADRGLKLGPPIKAPALLGGGLAEALVLYMGQI